MDDVYSANRKMAKEIDRLRAKNARLLEMTGMNNSAWSAMVKDAERWRAAKRKFTHLAYEHRWQYTDQNGCDAEAREMEFLELNDAAIDEAMKDE